VEEFECGRDRAVSSLPKLLPLPDKPDRSLLVSADREDIRRIAANPALVSTSEENEGEIAERSVRLDGVGLHYVESGFGRPVLLIHGFAQSSFCWRYLHGRLPGHRLIAPDLKGFGLSDKPADGRYGVDDQARLLSRFVEKLGLEGSALVGHSFGGAVALRLVQRFRQTGTDPVCRLVLVDSAAYPQRPPLFIRVLRSRVLAPLALSPGVLRLGMRVGLRQAYHRAGNVSEEAVGAYTHAASSPGGRQALRTTARQILREDAEALMAGYARTGQPALLVWGEADTIVPPEIGARLAADLPNARLEILPNCGHCPQEEAPEALACLRERFLAEATALDRPIVAERAPQTREERPGPHCGGGTNVPRLAPDRSPRPPAQ